MGLRGGGEKGGRKGGGIEKVGDTTDGGKRARKTEQAGGDEVERWRGWEKREDRGSRRGQDG